MPDDDDHSDQVEHQERIEALKRRTRELTGGEMITGKVNDAPPEVEEGFWNYVVAFEEAPWIKHRTLLERAGLTLPTPDTLSDEDLSLKLWEVIECMASMQHFLEDTDHLSDRELYTLLLTDVLEEETKDMVFDKDSACHIPLCGSGSEEDNFTYLKYYADERFREQFHEDFPDEPIPDHEDPPYDRDRFLPFHDHGEAVEPGDEKD